MIVVTLKTYANPIGKTVTAESGSSAKDVLVSESISLSGVTVRVNSIPCSSDRILNEGDVISIAKDVVGNR